MKNSFASMLRTLCLITIPALLIGACDGESKEIGYPPPPTSRWVDVISEDSIPEVAIPDSAIPQLVLQMGPVEPVQTVGISPDGTLMVSLDNRVIRLWDLATGRVIRVFEGSCAILGRPCFSPDGKLLVGTQGETVVLWDVSTGKQVHTLDGHSDEVISVSFSPDGRTLASSSWDDPVRVWDIGTRRSIRLLQAETDWDSEVVFSPDGKTLACGTEGGTVEFWNVATGRTLRSWRVDSGSIVITSFSPDGRLFAAATDDSPIKLLDLASGNVVSEFETVPHFRKPISFSPDGRLFACAGNRPAVRMWDVATGALAYTVGDSSGEETFRGSLVAFTPDDRMFSTTGMDHSIGLSDIRNGRMVRTIRGYGDAHITSLGFSPDGRKLACGNTTPYVTIWDAVAGKARRVLNNESDGVSSVDFTPDGSRLAVGSARAYLARIWNVATGKVDFTLRVDTSGRSITGWEDGVSSLGFTSDGQSLITQNTTRVVEAWDMANRTLLSRIHGPSPLMSHRFFGSVVGLDKARGVMAFATEEGTIEVWNVLAGRALATLPAVVDSQSITAIGLSPDGTRLASGQEEGMTMWDLRTRRKIWSGREPYASYSSIDYSPDGGTFASGGFGGIIRLWSSASGRVVRELEGHIMKITAVSFSPNGRTLASGSEDGTVRIWDLETGAWLGTLFAVEESSWGVIDSAGHFDGSADAGRFIHWVVGNRIIPFRQLAKRFHRPGLLESLLAGR